MPVPEPQPGLVVSYAYLWRQEHLSGRTEGAKDRPCVIVTSVRRLADGRTSVTVVPITHVEPEDGHGVEIPAAVKRALGLDDQRSWVVVSELNRFVWPGFDLHPIPRSNDRFAYGLLPPRLFQDIRRSMAGLWRTGRGASVPRDDG